ncbi:MAG: SIMPL domain-containing protein [Microgenomates group bacterium]
MNTKNIIITITSVVVALFIIKILNIGYPLHVSVSNTSTELAVVGEGRVDVIPDVAYVDVGVTVNNVATVEEARKKIDKINTDLVAAVKKLGISSKEIKTTNYSVYPSYSYENGTSRIVGYEGNATVTIKTKKIGEISLVIEAATKAGANQINNTRFVVDNPAKYREEARGAAIKNAKEQAKKLVGSLGIRLGRVINIVESLSGESSPAAPMYQKFEGGEGGSGPSLEAGAEVVTSTVTLYFEKR